MFEAEYARRRTTAEAEAGRICSGDTVYLAGGEDAQDVLCRGRAARDALFGVVAAGADSKAVEGNPPPALADGYG